MSPCSLRRVLPRPPGVRGENFQKSFLKWRLSYYQSIRKKKKKLKPILQDLSECVIAMFYPPGGRGLKMKKCWDISKSKFQWLSGEAKTKWISRLPWEFWPDLCNGEGKFEIDEKNSQKKITRILKNPWDMSTFKLNGLSVKGETKPVSRLGP